MQRPNRMADFFKQNESIRQANRRIYSNRESECSSFDTIPACVRQTDISLQHSPRYSIAR